MNYTTEIIAKNTAEFLNEAVKFYKLNLSVVPIKRRGKEPLVGWKQYQTERAEIDQLARWFRDEDQNIGIITGIVSGIVVLDVDSADALNELSTRGWRLPKTVSVKTGRGWHYYFSHPGENVPNLTGLAPGIDLRGDGGLVVAPPSVHETGSRYEWIVPFHPDKLAEIPKWLGDKVAQANGSKVTVLYPQRPAVEVRQLGAEETTAYGRSVLEKALRRGASHRRRCLRVSTRSSSCFWSS